MANKASKTVVAGPDAAIIAALATNPAALAAYMGSFGATPNNAAKAAPVGYTADKALEMFKASIKGATLKTTAKGNAYAVISFTHVSGKNGAACFWLV